MGVEENEASAWQAKVPSSFPAKRKEGGLGRERRHSTGGAWLVGHRRRLEGNAARRGAELTSV